MELPKPQDYRFLFLDMNSFFASIEQAENSNLAGKPIGVAPYTGNTGCIISPSLEAKKFGVKTGFSVGDAKIVCPQIIIIESRPRIYMGYHQKILAILENFSPFVIPRSVDEMSLEISPSERKENQALSIGQEIKNILRQNLGLLCSVGIGPNVFIAKQATEVRKPDGLLSVKIKDLAEFYRLQKLTDIKGIADGMERRLHHVGIYTTLGFFQVSAEYLRKTLGIVGECWWHKLHGYNIDPELRDDVPKSIGHSHVLAPKLRNEEVGRKVLQKLAEKVSTRLRAGNLRAKKVHLFVSGFKCGWTIGIKTQSFSDRFSLSHYADFLYSQCPLRKSPFMLAITATELEHSLNQPQRLFTEMVRPEKLSQAMDKINQKFGPNTVKPAIILGLDEAAPNRIPFACPPKHHPIWQEK